MILPLRYPFYKECKWDGCTKQIRVTNLHEAHKKYCEQHKKEIAKIQRKSFSQSERIRIHRAVVKGQGRMTACVCPCCKGKHKMKLFLAEGQPDPFPKFCPTCEYMANNDYEMPEQSFGHY